jgi:heme exporter protein A
MLVVHDLSKRFGAKSLFENLNFRLDRGDCLIVTGQNGSGKSTLLRILAELERPSSGTIETNINDLRTELGYSALDQTLFPNLTVIEHLQLASTLRGIANHHDETLDDCGLRDHENIQAMHLSSGLRSRLRIALSTQAKPKILLWDEPGVALDEHGRELVSNIIQEQMERGTMIVATNDPLERRFGTHALELN